MHSQAGSSDTSLSFLRPGGLRHEFDSERIPELSGPTFLQDIHSVSSLCKLYFRELPNPLLTYQLYGKFSVSKGDSEVGGCWDASGPVPIMPVHNHRRPCQCLGRTNAWCVFMMSSNSCPRHTIGKPRGVRKGCGGLTRELRFSVSLHSHPRTLEYLLRHLARMARHSANTSMHARNLAIVWAPNLLR